MLASSCWLSLRLQTAQLDQYVRPILSMKKCIDKICVAFVNFSEIFAIFFEGMKNEALET